MDGPARADPLRAHLITDNLADYERRAIELARDPAQLRALRQRLAEGRETSLLFDMPRFVRSFEAALLSARGAHS